MKSIVLFVFFYFGSLFADEVIQGVVYLTPSGNFSKVSDIYIRNKVIVRITESKRKDAIRYVLPSFCDAYVTLGANAVGGQNNLEAIKIALKSYLVHGFTHIQSVADGPWIYQIKSDVDSGKILGPKIIINEKPIIPKSLELESISDLLYSVVDNKDLTLKEFNRQKADGGRSIPIFNRNDKEGVFSLDQALLNQMRQEAAEENKILSIHTFAERLSIIDALVSGNRYLVHPILSDLGSEISELHKKELHLTPILNVYRNLQFTDVEEEDGKLELEFLRNNSKFFVTHYVSMYETNLKMEIPKKELKLLKSEYSSYLKFLEKNPILKQKLILGSGAGNRLSFHGLSGIQELKILSGIWNLDEFFFRIPTQNSCSFMSFSYDGVIAIGREANLLVLKENPLKNIDTLFQIEEVFKQGKPVLFTSAPTKKNPKRR